jgi:methionyl-tRNA formyltransferase
VKKKSSADNFLVLGVHNWNLKSFRKFSHKAKNGNWYYQTDKSVLNETYLETLNPKYIFVLHWSEIIPKNLVQKYNFVIFHMTDLPFGRGGSPLQNLISLGYSETKISAIKATPALDEGDIFLKRHLDLSGNAMEIYSRASDISMLMAIEISNENFELKSQSGKVTNFTRRTPDQSEFPHNFVTLTQLHNFIRMLDAPNYPSAFIDYGNYRFFFENSNYLNGELSVTAKIVMRDLGQDSTSIDQY